MKKPAKAPPAHTAPAAPPVLPPAGGSWIRQADGRLVRELPEHGNGGGRALTEDEAAAVAAAAGKEG